MFVSFSSPRTIFLFSTIIILFVENVFRIKSLLIVFINTVFVNLWLNVDLNKKILFVGQNQINKKRIS